MSTVLQLAAQDGEVPQLRALYITESIDLDGALDEPFWEAADIAGDFWQFFPVDSAKTKYPTTVRVAYDDNMLYVGIYAESISENYVVSTLKRDFSGAANDNVTLMFDTFNDATNAFYFGVTPYGVRREGLVSTGGASTDSYSSTWDVKWQAEAQRFEDHFTIEMAIPFTSLKFEEGATKWRFRPYRWNIQMNEQSSWARVPQTQLLGNLAFMGELIFDKPLGKSRTPMAVIPYVNALSQRDQNLESGESQLKIGGDAKIAVGDGLNLDLTINPDFSNVEVDDIFTNLTRFELRLPERRQFFIDNSDLFESFGNYFTEARPFFSRRIGLAKDKDGNLIQNQITAGARLSGKLNEDWRLGVLNIQTAEDLVNEIGSNNNMMIALQRKVAKQSNIGAFIVNRQATGDYEFVGDADKYNRVIGADYNLASADGVWRGRVYLHKSLQPDDNSGNLATQAAILYNTRYWNIIADINYIDQDFRSDLGFVPRTDIVKTGNLFTRNFYPKAGPVNNFGIGFLSLMYWRPSLDMKKTDHTWRLGSNFDFRDQSSLVINAFNRYIYLTEPFDPTRSDDGEALPGELGYTFNQLGVEYSSNNTRLLTYGLNMTVGEFFNGEVFSIGGSLAYRWQPWVRASLAISYDGISLPDPHPSADFWLVTPRVDVTFSKSVFWTTIIQYSNQRDNLGINSRLQWRFAPLSDLYLVYNDNYYTRDFGPRFRSINLKVSYWLNI